MREVSIVKILIGNIFESKALTLVNTVNCVGVMGKGIAKEFKERYPDMFKEYAELCEQGNLQPGKPYYYQDLLGNSIINFPTKKHWRSPSKLSYIVQGLKWFVDNYKELNISSVAFPPLGCGNGGLNWELVGPIMYHWLKDLPIEVEIYAPFGTKTNQLTRDFLESNLVHSPSEVLGTKSLYFNPKWMLILETINRINQRKYSFHVGRVMMQKICYILTDCGIDTGFKFNKGLYGPYCREVDSAITVFSNANLIIEKNIGKMVEMQVTKNFKFIETNFDVQEKNAVEKTVDLFSRIKRTSQAEMVSTVIFSYRDLVSHSDAVSEKDIFDYVINWKPRWKNKRDIELADSIRNLAILKWISPMYSEELPVPDDII